MNKPKIVLPDWAIKYMALEEFYNTVKFLVEHGDPCHINHCGLQVGEWKRCRNNYMCSQLRKKLTEALALITGEK